MPKINWEEYNDSPRSVETMPPGIYHVEVADSEERTSARGDTYFSVRLKEMESGNSLCFDNLMLTGNGLRIGLAKLSRLGFKKEQDEDIVAAQLIGRRAYVCVKEETYEGTTRLTVDIKAKTSACGYWSEENPPAERNSTGLEDAPF